MPGEIRENPESVYSKVQNVSSVAIQRVYPGCLQRADDRWSAKDLRLCKSAINRAPKGYRKFRPSAALLPNVELQANLTNQQI